MIEIFTGLVEEMGKVLEIDKKSTGMRLKVQGKKVLENAKLGDSIATNGTCLTAVELGKDYFAADIMNESVNRTNLKNLRVGDLVNLEKSVTMNTFLGGHLVTGDVDCEGKIRSIKADGFAKLYEIQIEQRLMKYIVEKGRVTLDGASLTIANFSSDSFTVSLIPHTQKEITLGMKKTGDSVNVETDLIGKYVERMLNFKQEDTKPKKSLDSLLKENGFF